MGKIGKVEINTVVSYIGVIFPKFCNLTTMWYNDKKIL